MSETKENTLLKYFEFDLAVIIGQHDVEQVMYDLYKNGCGDAIMGSGKEGVLGLGFCRFSHTREEAIKSAIDDIKKTLPDALIKELH